MTPSDSREWPSLPQNWSTTTLFFRETPSLVPRCCRTCHCQAHLPQAKPVSSLYCGDRGIGRASTSNSPLPPAACSTEPLARLHHLCKFCRLLIRCRLQNTHTDCSMHQQYAIAMIAAVDQRLLRCSLKAARFWRGGSHVRGLALHIAPSRTSPQDNHLLNIRIDDMIGRQRKRLTMPTHHT
jgi:hypothetical protein